jgi:hypothetical protein
MEEEVEMEGDDTDAKQEEGGRGEVSDAEEGEECGDITFVGGRVTVEGKGSMEGEGRVEEGGRVIGRREGLLIRVEAYATLVIADTSHL